MPNSLVPVSKTLLKWTYFTFERKLFLDLIMSRCLGSETWRGQGTLGKLVVQTKTGYGQILQWFEKNNFPLKKSVDNFKFLLTWDVCFIQLFLLEASLPLHQVDRKEPLDALLDKLVHSPGARSVRLETCFAHRALLSVVLEGRSTSGNYFSRQLSSSPNFSQCSFCKTCVHMRWSPGAKANEDRVDSWSRLPKK